MRREQEKWEKEQKRSQDKDPKNPSAGEKNGQRAKDVTGRTPGKVKPLPLRDDLVEASADEPSDNRGPRMSPRALGAAMKKSAEDAAEVAVGPFQWAARQAGAAKRTGLT
ncbi:hypothetical protein J4H86_12860 [Spiractinospora alimapuensis]|uniref:hypothetical protein n=1 Tax=Spiractinospora alimapuensis TaxID=2820884 RepID=UPI001F28527E|nr:hypothetical protein [Spiractinospora alimapuensis]QVQ54472.1 hypothetical protein J4H86_12860 [Spiractinospora alimapuensis]